MIDTFIVEEMILQMRQNELRRKQIINRLKFETSIHKRDNFLKEVEHINETNKEIIEMLLLEYTEGITTEELFKSIQP